MLKLRAQELPRAVHHIEEKGAGNSGTLFGSNNLSYLLSGTGVAPNSRRFEAARAVRAASGAAPAADP